MTWPQNQGLKSHQSQVTLESPPRAQETVCKLCTLFSTEKPCSWSLFSQSIFWVRFVVQCDIQNPAVQLLWEPEQSQILTFLLGKLSPSWTQLLHSRGPTQSSNTSLEPSCNNFAGETLPCSGTVVTLYTRIGDLSLEQSRKQLRLQWLCRLPWLPTARKPLHLRRNAYRYTMTWVCSSKTLFKKQSRQLDLTPHTVISNIWSKWSENKHSLYNTFSIFWSRVEIY